MIVIVNAAIIHGDEMRFYPDKLYYSKDFVNDANRLLYSYGENTLPSFLLKKQEIPIWAMR